MPLLDQLIRFVIACIGAPPYAEKFTAAFQASKIVVVVALVQQRAGHLDLIHEQTPQRMKVGPRNLAAQHLWITSASSRSLNLASICPRVALSISCSNGASSAASAKSEYVMRSDQNLWSRSKPRYEIVTYQAAYFTRHG
jgi:hypothetical protein